MSLNAKHVHPQITLVKPIRAELVGSNIARAATAGLTCCSRTPLLDLCGLLLRAGHDPRTPVEVYRGNTLALRVRSIGEAAELQIGGDGIGFRRRQPAAAPPALQTVPAFTSGHNGDFNERARPCAP